MSTGLATAELPVFQDLKPDIQLFRDEVSKIAQTWPAYQAARFDKALGSYMGDYVVENKNPEKGQSWKLSNSTLASSVYGEGLHPGYTMIVFSSNKDQREEVLLQIEEPENSYGSVSRVYARSILRYTKRVGGQETERYENDEEAIDKIVDFVTKMNGGQIPSSLKKFHTSLSAT